MKTLLAICIIVFTATTATLVAQAKTLNRHQQHFFAFDDTSIITPAHGGAAEQTANNEQQQQAPPPPPELPALLLASSSSALADSNEANKQQQHYHHYDSAATAALAAAAEPAIEKIPIIYDSKTLPPIPAQNTQLLEANTSSHQISSTNSADAGGAVVGGGVVESTNPNSHSEAAGIPLENVLQAVQHQTEKIYEGIMKLFVQLVGGDVAAAPPSSHLEDKSSSSTGLLGRNNAAASRHAASCFNAIDVVGPNHDALRDAIADYHNTLRVERCLSALNLAMADQQQQQHQLATHLTALPTLLHWDDVLVKVADKILDIGAARACRSSSSAHHHHHHRHHITDTAGMQNNNDLDLHALALKKFQSFGVNAWQSHKTCSWMHVLNEWSRAAAGGSGAVAANNEAQPESSHDHKISAAAENITSSKYGSVHHLLEPEAAVASPSSRSDQHYRQMLWKEVTRVGCAATVVACGEFDRTVKLYACVYNARAPADLADSDSNMCGEILQQQQKPASPLSTTNGTDGGAVDAAVSSAVAGENNSDTVPEAVSSNTFGQVLKRPDDILPAEAHHQKNISSNSSEYGNAMSILQKQEAAIPESNTVQIGSSAEFGSGGIENSGQNLQLPSSGSSNSAVFGMIVNK